MLFSSSDEFTNWWRLFILDTSHSFFTFTKHVSLVSAFLPTRVGTNETLLGDTLHRVGEEESPFTSLSCTLSSLFTSSLWLVCSLFTCTVLLCAVVVGGGGGDDDAGASLVSVTSCTLTTSEIVDSVWFLLLIVPSATFFPFQSRVSREKREKRNTWMVRKREKHTKRVKWSEREEKNARLMNENEWVS